MRNLTQIAPDTALFVEYWDPTNRLRLAREAYAGYMLYDYSDATQDDDGDSCGYGTINFGGRAIEAQVSGEEPLLTRVADVGGYVFLSAFGEEAANTGVYPTLRKVVHDGQMNVLLSDGAVVQKYLKNVTMEQPKDIPLWTRTHD
jgi:hypothetical protein